jgi:tetratricopeptide (TPR) repeat protein
MANESNSTSPVKSKLVGSIRGLIEAVVLLMVGLSPWVFGCVEPVCEVVLNGGIALLLALWGLVILLEGRLSVKKCPLLLALGALLAAGAWQLVPFPESALRWVSPNTAEIYAKLLPAEPELLPGETAAGNTVYAPGSTISFYPGATTREVYRLLAVFLLLAAVRHNVGTAGAMKRLSVVATANGALLSLFALIQYFSSPRTTLYWTWPTEGEVFGPFICRNHFSFYINLCFGLGVGLYLSLRAGEAGSRRFAGQGALLSLLHNPKALWTGVALVFMLLAGLLSLSRAGFLAVIGATLLCSVLTYARTRTAWLGAGVLFVVCLFALLTWLDLGRVQGRLATLWEGSAASEDRIPLWSRLVPNAAEFPVFGTGYGTFDFVELMSRTDATDTGYLYEHAHNDYLEALLEGGLLRLALSLITIGIVYRYGYRAVRGARSPGARGLAVGAVFAFTTLVVHSFFDFGLHIPAIAVLATVVCAGLCALGESTGRASDEENETSPPNTWRIGGLAPIAGALVLFVLGAAIVLDSVRFWRSEDLRLSAARLLRSSSGTAHANSIGHLEAAAALTPESGRLHAQLGRAHVQLFQEGSARIETLVRIVEATNTIARPLLGLALLPSGLGAVSTLPPWMEHPGILQALAGKDKAMLVRTHLEPGLRHYRSARDLCPLLAEPHLQIAANLQRFTRAEPRRSYLERVKKLAPDDAEAWYLCGVQELFDGDTESAWKSWRRSLELSDRYQTVIVASVARKADAATVLGRVLPDRPAAWLAAARTLYPSAKDASRQRPLLEKALQLVEATSGPSDASDLELKGSIQAALGRPAEALVAFQAALALEPDRVQVRLKLANVLFLEGRFQDARRELMVILEAQPGHGEAQELLKAVAAQRARQE